MTRQMRDTHTKTIALYIILTLCAGGCAAERTSEMVAVAAGVFQMGDAFSEGRSDERPVRTVTVSAFLIGRNLVTNQQYADFLNEALADGAVYVSDGAVFGSDNDLFYCDTDQSSVRSNIAYRNGRFGVRRKADRTTERDPAVRITWYGAAAYCNWRSENENRRPVYDLETGADDLTANGYRLPTEAQWEYAARGGLSGKRFPWGNTITHAEANYNSSARQSYDRSETGGHHPDWHDGVMPYTSPVGSFAPNGLGLYDMAGNVWQWCNDWFAPYDPEAVTNPTGPASGRQRVLRGGAWHYDADRVRVAYRGYEHRPRYRFCSIGFRLALNEEPGSDTSDTPSE